MNIKRCTRSGILILVLVSAGCDSVKKKTKESINKGGEIVGKAGSEFGEGVSKGVERTLDLSIELSDDLRKKGLETGAYTVKSGDTATDNILTVYIIFNNDLQQTVKVRAFNGDALEEGRVIQTIAGKKGTAAYFDFAFDKRTNLDSRDKVSIE